MGRIAGKIIDIVFPIECLGCKKEGVWICEECARKITINNEPCCLECKCNTEVGEFCAKCKKHYNLDGVFIASDYDDKIIKTAIKTLKYRFVYDISRELAKLLFLFMQDALTPARNASHSDAGGLTLSQRERKCIPSVFKNFSEVIIIPVPLHKKRLRWRGFNQAEKLAEGFVKHFKLEMNAQDLQRVVHTKSQAKLNEAERKINLVGSLSWRGGSLLNKNIMIMDDVVTTGSTLEECAKVLKQAGAKEVWGLVVAKG